MLWGQLAIIFALTIIYIPLLGGYLTVFPATMAILAAKSGLYFGLAAIVIDLVHLFLFAPLLQRGAMISIQHGNWRPMEILVSLVFYQLGAGIVAIVRHRWLR